MLRLIVIRNSVDSLNYIGFTKLIAPSLAAKYGIIELVLFANAYNELFGKLNERQRRLVLPLSELVADVVRRKQRFKTVRNSWVAHLQDKDGFAEDASDLLRRNKLPDNLYEYHEMFTRIVIFVDTVQAVLPEIAGPAVDKFNRTHNAGRAMHAGDPEIAEQNVRARLERVRRKAAAMHPDIPWDSMLGAAGVRLEKLGGDNPYACPERMSCQPKGGTDAQ